MIVPNSRISPADPDKPVTDEYLRALNLNKKIIVSAQLAQQNLYEMCAGFKEMRDSKLYKELGYSDFGDYCEQETGIKRRQVYNYITIIEKLPTDFVQPVAQIGMRKLLILSNLSEEEREQITSATDLESATVKQLEQQIKQLRADKDKAVAEKSAAEADLALKRQLGEVERQLEEERSKPAPTAPADGTAAFNAYLKSAYDALNRLVEYINGQNNETYSQKAVKLIDSVKSSIGGTV